MRLAWRRPDRFSELAWTGFEAAATIVGVPRPEWMAAAVWTDTDRGVIWRADEMTLIDGRAISATADLTTDPRLPGSWWTGLRRALDHLASLRTTRVAISQAHLAGRIHEVYGDSIDTTIADWSCAHGDLGYANLCGPQLAILDWESWGMAPVGWDAACLWNASLAVPGLAAQVERSFGDVLSTHPGRLSQLLLCANIARAYRKTGRMTCATEAAESAAADLLRKLC